MGRFQRRSFLCGTARRDSPNTSRHAEEPGASGDLAVQCALLRDIIEDTYATSELLSNKFGQAVADGVSALTTKGDYAIFTVVFLHYQTGVDTQAKFKVEGDQAGGTLHGLIVFIIQAMIVV